MSFAFYLLATHQAVQENLFKEIQASQNDSDSRLETSEGRISLDMLKNMPYLNGVVFESMRLFPAVPVDVKKAARESMLPNGAIMPKGTVVTFEPL